MGADYTGKNKMDLGLKGRNAVVLGGTRGIGRAIAGTLAGEGVGVAVCARNADQVAGTVAELKAMGVKATGASVDITDAAALKSWISEAAKELGSIDMLFSNAGAMAQGGDAASWEQNFRLDVLGAVNAFEARIRSSKPAERRPATRPSSSFHRSRPRKPTPPAHTVRSRPR